MQQRFEEAALLLREADEHLARTFPEGHPLRAAARLNLASALVATGRLDEALRLVSDALEVYERVLDPMSDEIAMAYLVRGDIHAQKGSHERALADFAEASRRWAARPPEDPRNLPTCG